MADRDDRSAADRRRLGAARFAVASAAALSAAKFAAGIATGSLGILSSAVDNVADIVMSGVNYLSLRKASAPPDSSHPYGHGKVETLAALFQGMVIAAVGVWIVAEGVRRLRTGVVPGRIEAGIAVMLLSVAASWFIARRLRRIGEETDSPGLRADSLHYRTDVWSGGGILVSLVLVRATGWAWIDAAIGLLVGAYIVWEAVRLCWESLLDLTDRGLPAETVERIRAVIEEHKPMIVDFHDLRTRRSGAQKHVDFHVVVCREFKLDDAHRLADHLEWEVSRLLGNAHVVTHLDPCEIACPGVEHCARVVRQIRGLDTPEGEAIDAGRPGS